MRHVALGDTFDFKFTTRRFSTGAPYSLAGSPALVAYPDTSTVETAGGITLGTDHDGRTGFNTVRVVATVGNGYAAGYWAFMISSGTVDGVSVVGETVYEVMIGATLDGIQATLDRSTVVGVVTSGGSVTSVPTSSLTPAASVTDQFKGRVILFDRNTTTAALRGQGAPISGSSSGGTISIDPANQLTTAPVSGDTFTIV